MNSSGSARNGIEIPGVLQQPLMGEDDDGELEVVAKLVLDLTVYLEEPSPEEFKDLVSLYEKICPPDRMKKYVTDELCGLWGSVRRPRLTISGRAAKASGQPHPYFAPVLQRIRDGREFQCGFWDGQEIEQRDGSWAFSVVRKSGPEGLVSAMRVLLPLHEDFGILVKLARDVAERVRFLSGHGGLAFVYDPWRIYQAFDRIYPLAKRYWGIDVEHLNSTLPLMRSGIKGPGWITLLGQHFLEKPEVSRGLASLVGDPDIRLNAGAFGEVLVLGAAPVVGDVNQASTRLDAYERLARALESVLVAEHPDFPGRRFFENGDSYGWVCRFREPAGWR